MRVNGGESIKESKEDVQVEALKELGKATVMSLKGGLMKDQDKPYNPIRQEIKRKRCTLCAPVNA